MKRSLGTLTLAVLALTLSSSPSVAATNVEVVEIPIQRVFVPSVGFDDNDNIQLVVDGVLPNSCYTLAGQLTEPSEESDSFKIKQYAYKRHDDVCASEQTLPTHMKAVVPFSTEAWLGRMPIGDYNVLFDTGGGKWSKRKFNVQAALSPDVDNIPYAAIVNVYVGAAIPAGKPAEISLTGYMTSSCMELGEFDVKVLDDVVVVLPKVNVRSGEVCKEVLVPFEKKLAVGPFQEGRYLIHVRSMNGRAVTQTFSSIK
jgi:hypothetical protein